MTTHAADGGPAAPVHESPHPRRCLTRLVCRVADILLPGTGMLMAGRIRTGTLMLTTWWVVIAATTWGLLATSLHPLQAVAVLVAAYMALAIFAALVRLDLTQPPWNPPAALIGLVAFILMLLLAYRLLTGLGYSVVVVPDFGGFPAILPGEVVVVHASDEPAARGSLLAARTAGRVVTGRVVGMAGERLSLRGLTLSVNDATVAVESMGEVKVQDNDFPRQEAESLQAYRETFDDAGHVVFFRRGALAGEISITIPEDHVFLLSDNRSTARAEDSRSLGPLPNSTLVGKPQRVLWSSTASGRPRLNRLGAVWH